ncbi:thiamine pyrophosphate-binding protein [Pandoraea anhela]|uniref:Acetolactate synthase isozyme 3 large subunit n=1 Tax=Pandoraea anhela TaxID=2508295 RepID=A0A5E4UMH1_9BURK|nr:thiamine pyrophosphate-binding protein [Pandoraea anhela]VVE01107.1 Acetolactate synthase isozyme 3 large subunit [Pandoraea anhela]
MNVSDVVIRFLEERGIGKVFMLSGGGIMYLLDALGKSEKLGYVCNYHEQACAIAADGYARMNGFGVCFATFGPGAVNALAGVVGAWYDSVPMLIVSGQVRSNLVADYTKVRQVGPQEGNVLEMVKPVTKYAVSLRDPNTILSELEKAYHIAKSGRPGPVWLELPLDMQSAEVDWDSLPHWTGESETPDQAALHLPEILASLKSAKRPVLVLGNGVRLSGMHEAVLDLVNKLEIPTLIPYTGKDLLEWDNEYSFGVFGTAGQRHANIILQNSDLILGLGVGFCVAKTGFETKKFAVGAKKIFVDVDAGQLEGHPLKADLPILADLRDFVPGLLGALREYEGAHRPWLDLCTTWKTRYPMVTDDPRVDGEFINSYVFMDTLSDVAAEGDVVVTGNGLDCVSFYQAYKIKKHQRAALNGNWGSMGWDLPTAVGAHYATGKRTLCITGDGSLMLNAQELLTIGANKLPVKVFVFNNDGYGSIKATQNNFFEGRFVGSGPSSNVYNPDFEALAKAFGLGYVKVSQHSTLRDSLAEVVNTDAPVLCEVMVSPEQWISPKATSFKNAEGKIESKPLDDMFPFLPAEEIEENRRLAQAL